MEVFRRTSKNPVFQPAPTEERLFQPFLPFQTILPSWRWEIVNKARPILPRRASAVSNTLEIKLSGRQPIKIRNPFPRMIYQPKHLPAYMIYQPKQLEDMIPTDLSKGGPSLKACSKTS